MNNYFYTRLFPTRNTDSGNVPLILGIALILIGLFILVFPEILILLIGGSFIWLGVTLILWTVRIKRNAQQQQDSIHININN